MGGFPDPLRIGLPLGWKPQKNAHSPVSSNFNGLAHPEGLRGPADTVLPKVSFVSKNCHLSGVEFEVRVGCSKTVEMVGFSSR